MSNNIVILICIFGIMAITILVAWYCKRFVKSLDDFYVCGRQGTWWLFAGTVVASAMSMWTMIGAAGLAARQGVVPAMLYFAGIGVILFVFVIGPPLRRAQFSTIPEYFKARFGNNRVRTAAVACTVVSMISYIVVQLQGGAIMMEQVLGINYYWGILIFAVLLIIGMLFSGMWAVITTDTIGAVIITFVSLFSFGFLITKAGGFANFYTSAAANTADTLWTPVGNSGQSMLYLLGNNVAWIVITAASPHLLNRALIVKNERELYKGGIVSLLGVFLIATTIMIAFAGASNFLDVQGMETDYISVAMALQIMPPLVGGLYLGGAFTAGITTANTQVITCAQSIAKDFYQGVINKKATEKKVMSLTNISMVVVLIICMLITALKPFFMALLGTITGVVLSFGYFPALVMSLFSRRISSKATEITMWLSIPMSILVVVLWTTLDWFQPHPVIWGLLFGFVCINIVSIFVKPKQEELDTYDKLKPILFTPEKNAFRVRDKVFGGVVTALMAAWIIVLVCMFTFSGSFGA